MNRDDMASGMDPTWVKADITCVYFGYDRGFYMGRHPKFKRK